MVSTATLREVTLTLPMLPDMEIAATRTVTALAEFMEMSPDRVDEVRMAVLEACINAFEHSGSEDGKVSLTFSVLGAGSVPEKLEIRVRDFGRGFKPGDVKELMQLYTPGDHWLHVQRQLPKEDALEMGAEADAWVRNSLLALLPVYRCILWDPS